MLILFLSTLGMMGFTFVVGFVVASIIKLIAVWADSLEYHHSHHEELEQFGKLNKLRAKIGELLGMGNAADSDSFDDEREEFRQGVNGDLLKIKPSGYYHGVSHGASHLDLMDYYYPKDTRVMFLKKKEQMMRQQRAEKDKLVSPAE